jgi:ATP-dependent Clp protease adaptor protein ClpS
MSQLASRPDSPIPAVLAAPAPRMGNDENRSGAAGGPAASVITKVKPKTKSPKLYRVQIL